jgi:hypothetical protein
MAQTEGFTYVVDCAPAPPYTYSSSTHRFPDERTPIETTPLSAIPFAKLLHSSRVDGFILRSQVLVYGDDKGKIG